MSKFLGGYRVVSYEYVAGKVCYRAQRTNPCYFHEERLRPFAVPQAAMVLVEGDRRVGLGLALWWLEAAAESLVAKERRKRDQAGDQESVAMQGKG